MMPIYSTKIQDKYKMPVRFVNCITNTDFNSSEQWNMTWSLLVKVKCQWRICHHTLYYIQIYKQAASDVTLGPLCVISINLKMTEVGELTLGLWITAFVPVFTDIQKE
jgi:hypothetical protein